MRRALLISVLLCAPLAAFAGPKEDGQAVFEEFLRDFTSGNADAVANHFTPEAIFWGTAARDLITTPAGIRQYFVTAFAQPTLQAGTFKASAVMVPSVVSLSDDAVAVSGIWQVEGVADGKPFVRQNRNSIVVIKRGGRWLIASFHNSPRPPAP